MIPTPTKSILLVSRDASISGSPVLLLHLLDALKENTFSPSHIIIRNNKGALYEDFQKRGKVLFQYDIAVSKAEENYSIWKRIPRYLARKKRKKNIQSWIDHSDIILLNTIRLGEFLQDFHFKNKQIIISYIHELPITTELYFPGDIVQSQIESSHYFFVPSESVKRFLQDTYSVNSNKIYPLDYFIPIQEPNSNPVSNGSHNALKHTFSGQARIITIGILGTMEWRKGADLMPQILLKLFRNETSLPIHFIWKGAGRDSLFMKQIFMELKLLGLTDKIRFEDPESDTQNFFNAIDLLLLPSREDPYPLVVLEAARNHIPCIAFANAGGAPEFIGEGGGILVPFLHLDILVESIHQLYQNEALRLKMGETAFKNLRKKHSNPEVIKAQFNALMAHLE